ncbi:tetratricopeptide repeat protein [Agromyces humatus]|uniref:Tetratricopeptide repeat protein n=1 Tax=Agromyces humatus TaxID=279573 RepID=A0ABP4WKQ8_9MICO|nr:tetratricopeptide repeat protein [Agromyces humatus]
MSEWQTQVDAIWASADELGDAEVIRRIDALAAQRPEHDPVALFERAGARDSAGLETEAEPLYRAAIANGLTGAERVQAHIQLASTIRNLGRPLESIALLDAIEPEAEELHDAVVAFRALALVDAGDARRAASDALTALAAHLPRYRRSLAAYAEALTASA